MDSLMRAQGFRLTQRYWAYPDLKKPLFIMPCGSEKTFRAHLDALVAISADNPLHAKKWLLRLLYNAGLVQKFLPFIAVYTR